MLCLVFLLIGVGEEVGSKEGQSCLGVELELADKANMASAKIQKNKLGEIKGYKLCSVHGNMIPLRKRRHREMQ